MQYSEGITIVIPVYNSEKTIKRCVESIINQTYKNWKLVLVDDGSTDASPSICDAYAQNYDSIIAVHKENGGVSAARNLGIKYTRTEYLMFVDSDDFVDADYLQTIVDANKTCSESQNTWCCFRVVNSSLEEVGNNIVSVDETYSVFRREQFMELHKLWQLQGPVCKLYKTELINNNNLHFNEEFSLGEDLMFNLDYLDVCGEEIVIINKCNYAYFKSDDGLNSQYRSDDFEIRTKLNQHLKKYLEKWNVAETQHNLYYDTCYYSYDDLVIKIVKNKELSFCKKAGEIRKILKNESFKNVLRNKTCYINPILKALYFLKFVNLVIVFYTLVNRRTSEK